MSRDEEFMFKGEEAKRRLGAGIERSKALIAQYRTSLLTLRDGPALQGSAEIFAGAQPPRPQR